MATLDAEITLQDRGNVATMIRHSLRKDSHGTWGFVLYRTDYSSDDDWRRFLAFLRLRASERLQNCEGLDLMESFTFMVFDDEIKFNKASTAEIRAHFKQWAETAPLEE